jgi:steroid delta-isomerase-like uncharacterized protein
VARPANDPAADPPTESPVAVVRAYIDALNAHDADAICSFVSEGFFNEHTSVRGQSVRGRDEYRTRLSGFLASMLDLRYEIERVVASKNDVTVAYSMSALWVPDVGDAGSREPRPFTIRGVFWFRVEDGKIAHRVDYRDGVDFEQQVGLRP